MPIDAEVTVIGLVENGNADLSAAPRSNSATAPASVSAASEVALISHRTQALGTEIFTAVGIDLATKRYVGVKSTNHFHAAYAPIATKVLYCDGEGPSRSMRASIRS